MIKVNDYVVCIKACGQICKDEVIRVKDIAIKEGKAIFKLYGYEDLEFDANCFEFYDYYNIPYQNGMYPKPTDKIEETPVSNAMRIIRNELNKDKSNGSWYHSWQSNIAVTIMDNSDIDHEKANEIAKKFLELLISD